jgi:hypothetical protein
LISRRSSLLAGAVLVAGVVCSALAIEYNDRRLSARLEGDYLHISAPHFSFLTGKSLERLKDGASVAFIAQLTVSSSPSYVVPDARSVARFAVSYDIWEERFSVTRFADAKPGDRSDQKRSVSHLLAPAAEGWCLDNLVISRSELPADRQFYVQLDLREADPRDQSGVIGDSGISIARMVEIFSRPVREKQIRYLLDSGPLRLDEIRKGLHG